MQISNTATMDRSNNIVIPAKDSSNFTAKNRGIVGNELQISSVSSEG